MPHNLIKLATHYHMRTKEHERITRKGERFFTRNLPKLEIGDMEVDRFLQQAEEIEQLLVRDAIIYTTDFNEWTTYFRENYPEVAEESIQHEHAHSEVAARYGVSVTYGLVLITDSESYDHGNVVFGTIGPTFVQAFLTDNSREIAKRDRWNASTLLNYVHDLAHAPTSPSAGDQAMML